MDCDGLNHLNYCEAIAEHHATFSHSCDLNLSMLLFLELRPKSSRNNSSGLDPTLLIHSSAPWAVKNTDVKTKEEAGEVMLARLKEVFPELPAPKKVIPHFWRYGQIYKPYPGAPGYVTISENPLVIAGGDSFMTTSNLSMCAQAAEILADRVKEGLNIPNIPMES